MRAWCLIRDQPVYRRAAFVHGLRRAGYQINEPRMPALEQSGARDVLVIWNRYGDNHEIAKRFEKRGGYVVVAENGYIANDRTHRTRFAMALRGHNGIGTHPYGGRERWDALGVELKPWRRDGKHVLVMPNRSFGTPGYIMPGTWPEQIVAELKLITRRPIVVRPHPGNDPAKRPLAEDLRDAWAAVIWTTSAGYEALIEGIPVFCRAPWWIGSIATKSDLKDIEAPLCDDAARLEAFRSVAWAQWSIEEIERGDPFQHLCNDACAFADRV